MIGTAPPAGQEIEAIQPTGTTLPPNNDPVLGLGSPVSTLEQQESNVGTPSQKSHQLP